MRVLQRANQTAQQCLLNVFTGWRHGQKVRLVEGEPFFRMREGEGVSNTETLVEVCEKNGDLWRYAPMACWAARATRRPPLT